MKDAVAIVTDWQHHEHYFSCVDVATKYLTDHRIWLESKGFTFQTKKRERGICFYANEYAIDNKSLFSPSKPIISLEIRDCDNEFTPTTWKDGSEMYPVIFNHK